ncbi:hypothetical protein AB0J90_05960 [Micromonospora sp. NPDC049523]|uniref:hypothetical protein n=1 Tax=Micromonospora sp. NPDC049523 TaxID=3155921 RepID=UPI00344A5256
MTAVPLSRPLWWVARRSLRLLTGLILMALVLGLSAAAADAAPPSAHRSGVPAHAAVTAAATATEPQAGTPPADATRSVTPATGVTEKAVRAGERVDSDVAADRAPAADRVTVTPGQPDRRTVPHRPARSIVPAGAGPGLPAGPRAPPLG